MKRAAVGRWAKCWLWQVDAGSSSHELLFNCTILLSSQWLKQIRAGKGNELKRVQAQLNEHKTFWRCSGHWSCSLGRDGHDSIHTKKSCVTLLVTSICPSHPAAAKSLSLTPHKWNYFLCMTHKVSPTLLHWPSSSSSGSQWSTGAQLLGFLPCMNFRAKCHPALKLSVDFSSKFKTLVNLFTAAVAVINVLYVFPFWKINTRGLTKIIRVQKCCDLRSL